MNTDKGERFNTVGTEERRRQIGERQRVPLRRRGRRENLKQRCARSRKAGPAATNANQNRAALKARRGGGQLHWLLLLRIRGRRGGRLRRLCCAVCVFLRAHPAGREMRRGPRR